MTAVLRLERDLSDFIRLTNATKTKGKNNGSQVSCNSMVLTGVL